MPDKSPIALFAYNRPDHVKRAVNALIENAQAKDSVLYAYSDGPKTDADIDNVAEVRSFIRGISGFKQVNIIERAENIGLYKSITSGVSEVIAIHGRAIVIEDDIVCSPHFLDYMNDGLDVYEDETKVACIHAYVYPITGLPETFFLRGADCWGWATWKRAWEVFNSNGKDLLNEIKARKLVYEFDRNGSYPFTSMLKGQAEGKVQSWAILWHASAFVKGMFTLYPGKSLVSNIGLDATGAHSTVSDYGFYHAEASGKPIEVRKIQAKEDLRALELIAGYQKARRTGLVSRLRRLLNMSFST